LASASTAGFSAISETMGSLALSRHSPEVAAARYHELLRRAVASPRV